jgi:hypothetical protein
MAGSSLPPPPVGKRLVKIPSRRIGKPVPQQLQVQATDVVRASAPFVNQQTNLSPEQIKVAIAAVVKVLPEVLTHVVMGGGLGTIESDACGGNACAPHFPKTDPQCNVQCGGESICGAQGCPYNSCASHHCGGQDCTQHACSSESCPNNVCGGESCNLLACSTNEGCNQQECPDYLPCLGETDCATEQCAAQTQCATETHCEAETQCAAQTDGPPTSEPPATQLAQMTKGRLWAELVAEIASAGPRAIDRARALQLEVITRR